MRLWDLMAAGSPTLLPVRLQGHVNTSRNLIKATFGPGNLVFGGSEDGSACVWTRSTGKLLSRLVHTSDTPNPEPVYDVRYVFPPPPSLSPSLPNATKLRCTVTVPINGKTSLPKAFKGDEYSLSSHYPLFLTRCNYAFKFCK